VSSTLLDTAVTPAVFFRFGRRAAERALAREAGDPLDVGGPETRVGSPAH
jgi:hypothetical protein